MAGWPKTARFDGTFQRSRELCWGCGRPGLRGIPHHTGVGKHNWMLTVVGGALVVALAAWIVRRREARTIIEPTAEKIRSDFR
ncbi:LPXTG cell wall anchor domain-containing protein [Bradyrhizobium sediminis]|uniref:LPXTG cell wall anchor domain-containing protein n=1 Tax=Bradyrhizobium sediminis TaxID=2840469 RepID=A0A975RXJ6_9BRAD|nr:LPXTG cell wall anchor domain-containing protein [Bradyrhizobium sediminis]